MKAVGKRINKEDAVNCASLARSKDFLLFKPLIGRSVGRLVV